VSRLRSSFTEAPSNSLTSALSALSSLQQTQKSVLVLAVQNFVESLLPTLSSSSTPHGAKTGIPGLLEKGGWEARDGWDAEDWLVWSLWGWWREFCRLVSSSSALVAGLASFGSSKADSLPLEPT
jgi:nuclear cap-binding protein subunit 1